MGSWVINCSSDGVSEEGPTMVEAAAIRWHNQIMAVGDLGNEGHFGMAAWLYVTGQLDI